MLSGFVITRKITFLIGLNYWYLHEVISIVPSPFLYLSPLPNLKIFFSSSFAFHLLQRDRLLRCCLGEPGNHYVAWALLKLLGDLPVSAFEMPESQE